MAGVNPTHISALDPEETASLNATSVSRAQHA